MDDLQHEKEQIEEIKAWWAEYGRYIIIGVVLAVAGLVGWNQYQSSKLEAQVAASDLFESLTVHVSEGDLEEAEAVAAELATDFANTAYAAQSKLAMARLYMDKNRDQDAADALGELLAMRGNDELRGVGRQRLARILLYQNKPQDVVDLLSDDETAAFAGLYAESLGDAHAALGDIDKAAEAYREALADTSQTVNKGLVQMKLLDLPEAVAEEPETLAEEPEAPAEEPEEAADAEASPEEAGETE